MKKRVAGRHSKVETRNCFPVKISFPLASISTGIKGEFAAPGMKTIEFSPNTPFETFNDPTREERHRDKREKVRRREKKERTNLHYITIVWHSPNITFE